MSMGKGSSGASTAAMMSQMTAMMGQMSALSEMGNMATLQAARLQLQQNLTGALSGICKTAGRNIAQAAGG